MSVFYAFEYTFSTSLLSDPVVVLDVSSVMIVGLRQQIQLRPLTTLYRMYMIITIVNPTTATVIANIVGQYRIIVVFPQAVSLKRR